MSEGVIALQCHSQEADHLGTEALEMPMVDEKFHDTQAGRPTPAERPKSFAALDIDAFSHGCRPRFLTCNGLGAPWRSKVWPNWIFQDLGGSVSMSKSVLKKSRFLRSIPKCENSALDQDQWSNKRWQNRRVAGVETGRGFDRRPKCTTGEPLRILANVEHFDHMICHGDEDSHLRIEGDVGQT